MQANELSVEISLEELRRVALQMGFALMREESVEAQYIGELNHFMTKWLGFRVAKSCLFRNIGCVSLQRGRGPGAMFLHQLSFLSQMAAHSVHFQPNPEKDTPRQG